jgi:topoisomerase-4 subunit A
MIDLPNEAEIAAMKTFDVAGRLLVAGTDGRGFILDEKDALAQTKAGKVVLNVDDGVQAVVCVTVPQNADHVAVISSGRKMLVFKMADLPVMAKGKGVILQRFKTGRLTDVRAFNLKEGLTFKYGAGETKVDDVKPWIGERAQAGLTPPNGFPKNNKFS